MIHSGTFKRFVWINMQYVQYVYFVIICRFYFIYKSESNVAIFEITLLALTLLFRGYLAILYEYIHINSDLKKSIS